MRNIKTFLLVVLLVFIGLASGGVSAQEVQEPRALVPVDLPALPDPGLVPGDFFFFLDGWGEEIEEFFTFNPEVRARLQAARVLERTAEIEVLLKRDGIDSPYLAEIQKRIQGNMNRAARILGEQEARGVVVAGLAKELDDKFGARHTLLEKTFDSYKEDLDVQVERIKFEIREARRVGNFDRITELRIRLVDIEARKERIYARRDYLEKLLEIEEEKIKAKMDIREREFRVLADQAKTLFNQRERGLEQAFQQRERDLEMQEKTLETQLSQAILVEDVALAEKIRTKLLDLEVQEEIMKREKGALEENLEQERGRLKRAMVMQERAVEQIEEVREDLLDFREEMLEVVEVPAAVLELIRQAQDKLAIAEQALIEGNYGKAFGQAIAAEMLIRNAERILDKLEEVDQVRERGCQTDADCIGLICPMVVGGDTPICDIEIGTCFCGYRGLLQESWQAWGGVEEERMELIEKLRTKEIHWTEILERVRRIRTGTPDEQRINGTINKIEAFFGVVELDERKVTCIEECSPEIERAKDCVVGIIPGEMGPEELLQETALLTRVVTECLDEALVVRTCLKEFGCYQLFVDKLRETKPEVYEAYERLAPLLPGFPEILPDPGRVPDGGRDIIIR